MRAIIIDAGHGLNREGVPDHGAKGDRFTERELVLRIANRLYSMILADGIPVFTVGVKEPLNIDQHVYCTNGLCLDISEPKSEALLISIHMNAGPPGARGVEAWYGAGKDPAFAEVVARSVSRVANMPLREKLTLPSNENRHGSLAIVDKTAPVSCLLECGFVTDPDDVFIVENNLENVCFGIKAGIYQFAGIGACSSEAENIDSLNLSQRATATGRRI